MIMKKSWFAAAVCAATVASVGTGAAFAGEITGNGGPTAAPGHANSACAFSGREDAAGSPLRTQTPHAFWDGSVVVYPPSGIAGIACRGGSN
jgi:hypothetical protein